MCDFDARRRKFLAEAVTGLGIMMMPFPFKMYAHAQGINKGRRQHLINLIDDGGWDTNYTLNYFDPYLINELSNAPVGYTDLNKPRYGSLNTAGVDKVIHPTGQTLVPGAPYLGPGLKNWTASDFAKTMIVRGMPAIAGHGQHQFIYGGGTSPYMASYSALVAAHQANTRGPVPLHYVKLSTKTRDWIHSGMMTGVAIPALLPDQKAWDTLTKPRNKGANVIASDSKVLEESLDLLGKAAAKKVKRNSALDVISGYLNGYSASVLLSSSGYGSSNPFLSIWMRYFNALKAEANSQATSGLGVISGFKDDQSGQGLTETAGFKTRFDSIAKDTTVTLSTLTIPSTVGAIEFARVLAWKFAITEFLIVNDLSAVVDLSPTGNDSHGSLIFPGVQNVLAFTAYRELINQLANTKNPEGPGSLLDCTLVTYGSEFDRMGTYVTDNGNWGTGHGSTFSMVMAGHGCNKGKLIGSMTLGEKASGIFKSNQGYGQSIPFDPVTGALGTGSVNPYSIFPTVMQIMGVDIPAQQITDFKPIPVLIG
jgi:hypothetical protein